MKIPKIILIGGTGRSGTNITKEILSRHSKVATLPFEHRFIIDPDGIIDFYNSYSSTWSPFMADIKIKRLEKFLLSLSNKNKSDDLINKPILKYDKNGMDISPKKYYGWELNKWFPGYDIYVKELIDELKEFDYRGCWPGTESYTKNNKVYFAGPKTRKELASVFRRFLYKCINSLLKDQDKEIFVEDNTWNILFAKELFEILPNIKLINVLRYPHDVIASMKKQRWCPKDLSKTAIWYKSIIDRWLDIKKNISSKNIIEIKLEMMVKENKQVIKKICEFSEIDFEKDMLKTKLDKSNEGRWKKEFSENEIEIIDNIIIK